MRTIGHIIFAGILALASIAAAVHMHGQAVPADPQITVLESSDTDIHCVYCSIAYKAFSADHFLYTPTAGLVVQVVSFPGIFPDLSFVATLFGRAPPIIV